MEHYVLLLAAEYLLATRDVAFLEEQVSFYGTNQTHTVHKGESAASLSVSDSRCASAVLIAWFSPPAVSLTNVHSALRSQRWCGASRSWSMQSGSDRMA